LTRTIGRSLAILAALLCALVAAPATAAFAGGTAPAVAADGSTAASPAVAKAMSDCPLEYWCIYASPNFGGSPGKWKDAENNYGSWPHAGCPDGTWNNCAQSVYNHGRSYKVSFFDDYDQGGAFFYRLPAGSYLANLAQDTWSDGTSPNRKIDSHNWHAP
jgi:hypothetical protein